MNADNIRMQRNRTVRMEHGKDNLTNNTQVTGSSDG